MGNWVKRCGLLLAFCFKKPYPPVPAPSHLIPAVEKQSAEAGEKAGRDVESEFGYTPVARHPDSDIQKALLRG